MSSSRKRAIFSSGVSAKPPATVVASRKPVDAGPPRLDLVIQRTAPAADAVVGEMKASRSLGCLGSGLSHPGGRR